MPYTLIITESAIFVNIIAIITGYHEVDKEIIECVYWPKLYGNLQISW
jgi:hypothetical protein